MSLEIIPYDESYVEDFSYWGVEREFFSSAEEVREIIKKKARKEGTRVIGLLRGKVIFVLGINFIFPQVGEAWLFLNPPPPKFVLPVCRAIASTVHLKAKEMNLYRLQALCFPLEKAMKLSEFVGFRREAVLHSYYKGMTDVLVYAILWGERWTQ